MKCNLRKNNTRVIYVSEKQTFELMNFRGAHTPLQPFNSLPSEAERRRNMTKVTSGASLVSFSLLRSRWKKIQQQEGSAMATLDRQLPNPDTFLCKPWSTFISAAKLHYSDSKCTSILSSISIKMARANSVVELRLS